MANSDKPISFIKWFKPHDGNMSSKIALDKAGRVVLPKTLRDELHLVAGDTLGLKVEGDQVPAGASGRESESADRRDWQSDTSLRSASPGSSPSVVHDPATELNTERRQAAGFLASETFAICCATRRLPRCWRRECRRASSERSQAMWTQR